MGVVTLYQIFSYSLMIEILILDIKVNDTESNLPHTIAIGWTNVRHML